MLVFSMKQLLSLAETYASATSTSTISLAEKISGNWKLFTQIKSGKACTAKTAEAATEWFLDNWPEDIAWPHDQVPDLRQYKRDLELVRG